MADNVNTATYYLSMDLPKLDPNEAKKVTRYAVGNSISNNVTAVELVEVKQEGKDVTEHFIPRVREYCHFYKWQMNRLLKHFVFLFLIK